MNIDNSQERYQLQVTTSAVQSTQSSTESQTQNIVNPLDDEMPDAVGMSATQDANTYGWDLVAEELIPNTDKDASSDCFLPKFRELLENFTSNKWEEFEATVDEFTQFDQSHVSLSKQHYKRC